MSADEQTAVLTFALRMHAKLNQNRHKGGRPNWLATRVEVLLDRLGEELFELQEAQRGGDAEAIANECADVANFAMMISDWYLERAKQIQKQNESTS